MVRPMTTPPATLKLSIPARSPGTPDSAAADRRRHAEPPKPAPRPMGQVYAGAQADAVATARLYAPQAPRRPAPRPASPDVPRGTFAPLPRPSESIAHGRYGPDASERFRRQEQEWHALPFTVPSR